MATPDGWARVGAIAARRHGILTHVQLMEAGFSSSSISRAVKAKHLYRVYRGIYSLGHPPSTREAVILAACLACGPDALASHLLAGELHGLNAPLAGALTITTGGRARPRTGIHIHRSQVKAEERSLVDNVPCTSPSRTLADIAATAPVALPRAIKEASGRGLLDVPAIEAVIDAVPRRRGAAQIRPLLRQAHVPGKTRSELERRIFRLCRQADLPLPEMNITLQAGGRRYEVDCVWRRARLVVECDSRWHDNPISATDDAKRDQALTIAGWRVHRLRWAQVVGDPEGVASLLAHLLEVSGESADLRVG